VQILSPTPEENTQKQRQPLLVQSAIQASSQSSFISDNYTPLVTSRNDKNKQLTILSQNKMALTAINKLFAL
jgi:hypothetical protein